MPSYPHIVTIGGGTGAPTIIRSLGLAGFSNITAICASTDSGGRSGQIRTDERDRVISIGDLYNAVLALVSYKDVKQNHVLEFFDSLAFTNGRNRKAGYDWFYSQLEALDGDFDAVQSRIEKILKIKLNGRALPATCEPTHLCFRTKGGREHIGERQLDEQQMSKDMVVDAWINPVVKAFEKTLDAIKSADYIIYCPGSLYGSLITNFIPEGITNALGISNAIKILIPNLVSDRNQTHNFNLKKYWQVINKYGHLERPFDLAIVTETNRVNFEKKYSDVVARYDDEYSHFLDLCGEDLNEKMVKIYIKDTFLITPEKRIRHDPKLLVDIWKEIIK